MRTVYVVPHCHWDREWYQPFELFRWRLIRMVDEVIETLERDPAFACFNLDGQSIVIEDYLELRPENEGRLRALIAAGRIAIGPWWVQPDEFLPSGESHIRSLQRGIRAAARLGGGSSVGHCADQFGHIAQLPQLFAGLGLTSACLWRGVPDGITGWSFHWEAPDGTRLPVLYLRNSYSSGWRLPDEPGELIERTRRQEAGRAEGEPLLLMNGTDHSRIERHVPAALARAAGEGYDYRIATLAGYERAMFEAGIGDALHLGELRSPDSSNILAGVLSARMPIKQRDLEVSSLLERIAEPLELLAWLHGGPDAIPALRQAWRLALENTPHDSICGCSIDQVHREMFPRYDRAEQLARQVARESMAHLVRRLEAPAEGGIAVFRPVPFAPAVLECDVPDAWEEGFLRLPTGEAVPFALEPAASGATLYSESVTPAGAVRHLDFIREDRYDDAYVQAQTWSLHGRHLEVETIAGDGLAVADCAAIHAEVRAIAAEGMADTARVTVRRHGTKRLRAVLPPSDTVGVELLAPVPAVSGEFPADLAPWAESRPGVATGEASIANEFYEVRLRRRGLHVRDWRTAIDFRNINAFIDEGDRGDEYNADVLPGEAVFEPESRELIFVERDAVSATLTYLTVLDIPAALGRNRTHRSRRDRTWLPILSQVTLWAGIPRIDFRVTVENTAADHRLRALFPLPFAVMSAVTENQFHVAERPIAPAPWNGRGDEQPSATFPQKTLAAFEGEGAGMAVFNRGLPEGEVVTAADGRQAYALTLLRCVGWLSRPDLASRRGGAGPTIATPGAQLPGPHVFEYSLTSYRGGWRDASIQPLAHGYAHPPLGFATNAHAGSLGRSAPLATFGSPLVVPSALHRSHEDGAAIARVYSAAAEPFEGTLAVPAAGEQAVLADLMERHIGEASRSAGAWTVPLRPWQIASLRFGRRSP